MTALTKYLIFAPPFDENVGGVVCLHKLCHTINDAGGEAYLAPYFDNCEISRRDFFAPLIKLLRHERGRLRGFALNPAFRTPIYRGNEHEKHPEQWVVVYPEIVFGNPLKAKNVVRWLLHNPGYHTGKIYYGQHELHVKFNDGIKPFAYPDCTVASNNLKIIHYPLEHYNLAGASTERTGAAYCVRKGKGKAFVHEAGAILIDGKSHREIADIFKKVQTFVSYDTYTAYSFFAVLCGCDSIVIPDAGVDEASWYPQSSDRDGIAYGLESIDKARATAHKVLPRILAEHEASNANATKFMNEAEKFFGLHTH